MYVTPICRNIEDVGFEGEGVGLPSPKLTCDPIGTCCRWDFSFCRAILRNSILVRGGIDPTLSRNS